MRNPQNPAQARVNRHPGPRARLECPHASPIHEIRSICMTDPSQPLTCMRTPHQAEPQTRHTGYNHSRYGESKRPRAATTSYVMTNQPPVCDYEGSTYQATFWDTGERAYEDGAEAVALRALLPARGSLLLEIGAGAGRNTPRYSGFERVVLMDYSRTQLEQAQKRLGTSERFIYVAADVYKLPFAPSTFDAATMIRVIHHMADAPAALRQIEAVLAPGATFILEYANKLNLKAMTRYALGRQPWSPYSPEPVEFAALNFDFHPRTMKEWLGKAGFTLEQVRALSYFRLGVLKRLLPTRLLVGLDALIQPTGAWATLSPSVFVRARKGSARAAPSITGSLRFRCPACGHGDLADSGNQLDCPGCGVSWSYRDGIYDFKQPLAQPHH